MSDETLRETASLGDEAKTLLSSIQRLGIFAKVNKYLDDKALGCDPDNQKMAQRIVLSKQLLASIEREIIKVANDGKIAKIKIEEIENARTVKQKVFRR